MRVTQNTYYMQLLRGLQRNQEQVDRALRTLADGKRVRQPSDDPIASAETRELRGRLARLEGLDRASGLARTDLATLDATLGEAFNLLNRGRTLALAGASTPAAESNTLRADEIDSLREQLLFLANTSQKGRYLFGGTETLTRPFDDTGVYAGSDNEVTAPLDDSLSVGATLSGRAVFLEDGDLFAELEALAQALRDNDTAAIGATLPTLQDGLDRLSAYRAEVGNRMNLIDDTVTRQDDERLRIATRISELEDANLEEVIVQLTQATNALDAVSVGAAQTLGRSLFDYLG